MTVLYIICAIVIFLVLLTVFELIRLIRMKPLPDLPDKSDADKYSLNIDGKSFEELYLFLTGKQTQPAFSEDEIYALLSKQAADFIGTHDFASFCAAGSSVEDTVRTVMNASVERSGDMVVFRVEADGFLYNMVRIMTGTLIDISRGKIPADSIKQIIAAKNRFAAGYTAPARGLYLNKIHY